LNIAFHSPYDKCRDGKQREHNQMETLIPIIIQAISGAAGGGIMGNIIKTAGAAMLPKLIAGALGGVGGGAALGGTLATMLGSTAAMDPMSIVAQVVSAGLGGGVLSTIAGMVLKGK
jgi:hypothetical protein